MQLKPDELIDVLTLFRSTLPAYGQIASLMQSPNVQIAEIAVDLGRNFRVRVHNDAGMYQEITLPGVVREEDIVYIAKQLQPFRSTNRVGIPGTLHRVSAMRDTANQIVGYTIRIGTSISTAADAIKDLVKDGNSNILLISPPGYGKTSKLRCMAHIAAQKQRVLIVDGSNEIGGEAVVPHPSVGDSRRMMVPNKSMLGNYIVEAIENHTPEVIVIDEISNREEVEATRSAVQRGIRVFASIHGSDIRSLIDNPILGWLIGGVQTTIVGDDVATKRGTSKTTSERRFVSSFDVVVEIIDFHTIAVYTNVEEAVDNLLRGHTVYPEIRTCDDQGKWHVSQQYGVKTGYGRTTFDYPDTEPDTDTDTYDWQPNRTTRTKQSKPRQPKRSR